MRVTRFVETTWPQVIELLCKTLHTPIGEIQQDQKAITHEKCSVKASISSLESSFAKDKLLLGKGYHLREVVRGRGENRRRQGLISLLGFLFL